MNRQEILQAIKDLSKSQGYYQHLYDIILDGGDEVENFLNYLEEKNFSDSVDLVMYLEQ